MHSKKNPRRVIDSVLFDLRENDPALRATSDFQPANKVEVGQR